MYYKFISTTQIEAQPKSLTYDDRTYIGTIPEEILIANKFYKLIETDRPFITSWQMAIARYNLAEGVIMQSWQVVYKSLEECITMKLQELAYYDTSDAVNSFLFNGESMWFSKSDRASLSHLADCYAASGKTIMTLYYQGIGITLPIVSAQQMLVLLEVYAGDCYNATEKHRAAIQALTTVEDVINYDFTIGYPEKPSFSNEGGAE